MLMAVAAVATSWAPLSGSALAASVVAAEAGHADDDCCDDCDRQDMPDCADMTLCSGAVGTAALASAGVVLDANYPDVAASQPQLARPDLTRPPPRKPPRLV
jgi:hypothetical protein